MGKIRCIVERITYQNPENGYFVLKCRVKDYAELVSVVGNLLDSNVGSGLIKGVGPRFARRIVQKFGADTFRVIEENVELLIEVEGIGKKRVQLINTAMIEKKTGMQYDEIQVNAIRQAAAAKVLVLTGGVSEE